MREVFSDEGFAAAFLETERALLQVQEAYGLVPAGEEAKLAHFRADEFDLAEASAAALATGNPVAGLVDQLYRASSYAHFGITAHDAWDVAHVLQLRAAAGLVLTDLRAVLEVLASGAERHATTPMLGRTQGQAGAPTTFGFKLATWLDELLRLGDGLERARDEGAVVSVAGAVGTASSFEVIGGSSSAIEAGVASILGLYVSDTPWFTSRDRFVALAAALAQLCTCAGKIGHEIYNLQRTGIGELAEGGAFGSSATPQKSNPWRAQKLHGLGVIARNLAALVGDGAALAEGEREIGMAYAEWYGLAQLCLVSGRACADLAALLERLEVREGAMLANLCQDPSVLSESLSMLLSRAVGKERGYALMKAAMARYRAGQAFPEAAGEAFREAGLDAPKGLVQWPGELGWAPARARGVAAKARSWLAEKRQGGCGRPSG